MAGILIGRREVIVRGDGNCFYRAIARAIDEKSDKNHMKVRALCNNTLAHFPNVFEPLLFACNTIKEHLAKSCRNGTWAETADIYSCATVLQRNIVVYSMTRGKWMKFTPRVKMDAKITNSRPCDCPVTLVLHDSNPATNHFNLLQAEGDCCSAPKPENVREDMTIDLVNIGKEAFKNLTTSMPSSSSKSKEVKKPTSSIKTSKTTARKQPHVKKSLQNTYNKSLGVQKMKGMSSKNLEGPLCPPDELSTPTCISTTTSDVNRNKKTTLRKTSKATKSNSISSKCSRINSHVRENTKKDIHVPLLKKMKQECPHETMQCKIDKKLSDKEIPDFENMRVKELKDYIQQRGVPVSTYKKPDLVLLAQSLHQMNASVDPDYREDCIEHCLDEHLTLPAGKRVPDPFKMSNVSSDFSSLPTFGLMDIFNHLIMSKTEYDKDMLASWRSFDEYTLFKNGHVRSLQHKIIFDNDDSKFHVILGQVIPTQKEKTQEGDRVYKLWFILKPNGSIYSAFCRCKGGADQGCRHLGAALFELDDFLSSERSAVTSLPAYWNPKPMPQTKPLPFLEMKLFHSLELDSKRNITNYDESWIDSFDPRPTKDRRDIPFVDKVNFAAKLMNIDRDSGILDYLPLNENANEQSTDTTLPTAEEDDVSNLTILSKAKLFVTENNINEDNIHQYSSVFVAGLSTTPAERELVSQMTVGQHNNDCWHEIRHLLVTGKKMKGLYTR